MFWVMSASGYGVGGGGIVLDSSVTVEVSFEYGASASSYE